MNLFKLSGLFYHNSLDLSISNIRGIWLILLLQYFTGIPVFNANNVHPHETTFCRV